MVRTPIRILVLTVTTCLAAASCSSGPDEPNVSSSNEYSVGGCSCPQTGSCQAISYSDVPADDSYYITTFTGGGMACGGTADGTWAYVADEARFGCGAKVEVTANGKSCVAQVADCGPNRCVEEAAAFDGCASHHPVLDASPYITQYLFGIGGSGYSDKRSVTVKEVASNTPIGCPGGGGGGGDAGTGISRDEILSRARQWVNAKLHYCQAAYGAVDGDQACWAWEGPSHVCDRESNAAWNPYRSDCSGFVTWSWGLPPIGTGGYITTDYAPFSNAISFAIQAADLQPGDAVNNSDHIMLFEGWTQPGAQATFMEEPACSSATPYASEFTSNVSLNGQTITVGGTSFTAIRFNDVGQAAPPPAPEFVALAATPDAMGYWEVKGDGAVTAHGTAGSYGSINGQLAAPIVGMASTPNGKGYWLVAGDGGVFTFGDAGFYGSMGGKHLNAPVVGMAPTADGKGYWLVAADGGIFTFGDATFYGSMANTQLAAAVVGMAATPDGKGYWMVAGDGGLFTFGDAQFYGSLGNQKLDAPVVGMSSSPDGKGYWMVAADGGLFSFGDAQFFGSATQVQHAPMVGMASDRGGYWLLASDGTIYPFGNAPTPGAGPYVGLASTPDGDGYWIAGKDGGVYAFGDAGWYGSLAGKKLAAPVVGIAPTPDGKGYWLTGSDGGVFTFGDAGFYGSMGGKALAKPVVGIAAHPDGKGYWLTGADGGVFTFGSAGFHGSMGGKPLNKPVVGIASTETGNGYWLVAADGGLFSFGDAAFYGSMGGKPLNAPVVGMTTSSDGKGYWMVAQDGGLFSFGDAPFAGSAANLQHAPMVAMARSGAGGYWMVADDGAIYSFGSAAYHGGAN